MKTLIVRLAVVAFLFCAVSAAPAAARTWYILPDGTGDAPTIQAALDSCATGDIILVAAGTYNENLNWPAVDGIELVSESGVDVTIIDGGASGRVISITTGIDESTRIDSFTIRNGLAETAAGIACEFGSSPTITNNIITANTAIYSGGGIGLNNGSSPVIINNTISINAAESGAGGGIGGGPNCSPTIEGNIITENTSTNAGGGIILWNQCEGIVTGNTISNNESGTAGGGISCNVDASVTITSNTIVGNTATDRGGGIDLSHRDSSYVYGDTIRDNTAAYGAGICCRDEANTIIIHCEIANNNGDGVYCTPGPGLSANPIINYNTIMDNTGFGVRNIDPSVTVDALYNWWGDTSGPYHPTANPGGFGEEVSDYVAFEPWLSYPVGVESPPVRVRNLYPNFPNPFNPTTTIRFDLPHTTHVSLTINDLSGRVVRQLTEEAVEQPGYYEVEWNGRDDTGRAMPSGPYLVRLSTESGVEARKVMLIR